jgi:DNA-binding NtrC family response regulator
VAEHFARLVAEQNGWKPRGFTPEALDELRRYGWSGNVRELGNVVERLLLLTDEAVDAETVRQVLSGKAPSLNGVSAGSSTGTLAERVTVFEREVMLEQLTAHGCRVAEAGRAGSRAQPFVQEMPAARHRCEGRALPVLDLCDAPA